MGLGVVTLLLGIAMFGFGLTAALGCRDGNNLRRVGKISAWGIVVSGICFLPSAVAMIFKFIGWDVDWILPHCISIVLVLFPLAYVIAVGVISNGAHFDKDSRTNYLDALKTIITASGVAIAVVSAGVQPRFNVSVDILKWAVVLLIISVVFSVITMFLLSFLYDATGVGEPVHPGRLVWALGTGYVALTGFLLGFSYLARIPFYIQPPPVCR